MITELAESEANTLGFEINDRVTDAQGQELIARFERALSEHEQLNILIVLNEGASWGVDAGFEDIKWVLRHMKNMRKIAFVSSSNVWKWLVSIDSFFAMLAGIQEKHFDHADLAAAWQWLKS